MYYGRTNQQGSYILKQGDPGNHISVLAEGSVEVFQQNKLLSSIPEWTTFGVLGILYNCTRTASVKVHSDDVRSANINAEENDVLCLVIDSETFKQTVGTSEELQRHLKGYVANLARADGKKRDANGSSLLPAKNSSWNISPEDVGPDPENINEIDSRERLSLARNSFPSNENF